MVKKCPSEEGPASVSHPLVMRPPVGMPRCLATARPAWSAPVCPREMTRSIMPQPYWHIGMASTQWTRQISGAMVENGEQRLGARDGVTGGT